MGGPAASIDQIWGARPRVVAKKTSPRFGFHAVSAQLEGAALDACRGCNGRTVPSAGFTSCNREPPPGERSAATSREPSADQETVPVTPGVEISRSRPSAALTTTNAPEILVTNPAGGWPRINAIWFPAGDQAGC